MCMYLLEMLLGSSFGLKVEVDDSSTVALGAEAKPSSEPSSGVLATQESISEFITQVASLVK